MASRTYSATVVSPERMTPAYEVPDMTLSHRAKVCSLYRRALKLSLDWCNDRAAWRGQAMYIRTVFDANLAVNDRRTQRVLIEEAERILDEYKHPEPYRAPTAPGGSKWERNLEAPILDPPPKMDL
ncbi:hypothetical protein P152DRAFT_460299 [Eremomyces bilateralis CBS 781.70]|uniref:NADH dehydrogenase [ubiquinone] 1 beta subcomplex subunit 9 n=1 Tax=Eremomyces bilateralis CBS 781.70 TaxID=1392243 RepID=A0A6G1FY08_9PEZI|nr:uncharacterized protein P152DRAFT_460299 [Eremomyces bilateralis CBS 781.70]KAF1810602.1 hypothetical protein P152DRAFT_460299 [Eremomyces bilateralis CBS 781.70]